MQGNMQEIYCAHMVGEIIAIDGDADPNECYHGTRWTRIAQGRVLAGIGTGTDSNGATRTFTAGDNPGEYEHALAEAENAPHRHDLLWFEYQRAYQDNGAVVAHFDPSGDIGKKTTRTLSDGEGKPHNNVQPAYGVNWWRRDA